MNSEPGLERRRLMNIRGWEEFFKRENGAGASGISQERAERRLRAGGPRADNLFAHG